MAGEARVKEVQLVNGTAWTHFGEFPYDGFGRTETLQHWKLAALLEAGRYLALSKMGFFGKGELVTRSHGLFVVGISYSFDPHLWRITRQAMVVPYKISMRVSDIGKTSITLCSRMLRESDDQELAACLVKAVYVDRATRRPATIPDWFVDKYSSTISIRESMNLPRNPVKVSQSPFGYKLSVAPSDTDFNGHTNQAHYVRFCCDATQVALTSGQLPGYEGDIYRYDLKELQILYSGESGVGDKLEVLLWQLPDHPEKVHYVIRKEGREAAICQASMAYELHSPVPLHKL